MPPANMDRPSRRVMCLASIGVLTLGGLFTLSQLAVSSRNHEAAIQMRAFANLPPELLAERWDKSPMREKQFALRPSATFKQRYGAGDGDFYGTPETYLGRYLEGDFYRPPGTVGGIYLLGDHSNGAPSTGMYDSNSPFFYHIALPDRTEPKTRATPLPK